MLSISIILISIVFFSLMVSHISKGDRNLCRAVMKNKFLRVFCAFIAVVVVVSNLYVVVVSNMIKGKMLDYLKQENYSEPEIQSIKVKHSFINKMLSYSEWKISVVYTDEPESTYRFTLRNGNIVETGVSTTLDKEELKHK